MLKKFMVVENTLMVYNEEEVIKMLNFDIQH